MNEDAHTDHISSLTDDSKYTINPESRITTIDNLQLSKVETKDPAHLDPMCFHFC